MQIDLDNSEHRLATRRRAFPKAASRLPNAARCHARPRCVGHCAEQFHFRRTPYFIDFASFGFGWWGWVHADRKWKWIDRRHRSVERLNNQCYDYPSFRLTTDGDDCGLPHRWRRNPSGHRKRYGDNQQRPYIYGSRCCANNQQCDSNERPSECGCDADHRDGDKLRLEFRHRDESRCGWDRLSHANISNANSACRHASRQLHG